MLLPDPRRRGEIHFSLAKSLPYNRRLTIIAVLLAAGFAVELFWNLYVGAGLLLVATLLAIVKGFSNIPQDLQGASKWQGAERAQLENIITLDRKSRQWDQSALDITCGLGAAVLLLFLAVMAGVTVLLFANGLTWLAQAWALDGGVLLLPHWVTGVRQILKNDPLTVKVRMLLSIMDFWEQNRQEGEALMPQMEVLSTKAGEIPRDAKLVLRLSRLGDAFLGLQVQIVLNRVQGSDYPYLYCVLVARKAFGMFQKLGTPQVPEAIVAESQTDPAQGVDVLVIRQETTQTSGYHTNPAAAARIFACALAEARRLTV
jgi:hypothetical protein